MVRKVFRTGNSLVVSLPKDSVELLGLHEGTELDVLIDAEGGRIIFSRAQPDLPGIDATFAQQLDAFIEQYRPALEALAE
jgi:putative addiction module antidote